MEKLILIADDDPDVRLHIAEILDAAGFDFDTATDGNETLLMLELTEPDLLLVDLAMPRKDGWQLIREVRANPHLRDLPIVTLSESFELRNATIYGVQGNISKPISPLVMLDTLDEVLGQAVGPADW